MLPSFAGGPLEVRRGKALSYGKRPLVYRYDQGMLGTLSNTEAIELVEGLFSKWKSVSTANIKFKKDNPDVLNVDVNENNFQKFLKPKSQSDLNGFTPIVFDEDGKLFDAFFGEGGGNIAVGIGGPVVLSRGKRHKIAESQIVLNGRFLNGIDAPGDREISLDVFKRGILHEIGHAINLDHSQINEDAIEAGVSQEIKDSTPLMFPRGVSDKFEIKQDDASALSYLYPNKETLEDFGQVEGKVFRKGGKTPVLGANVIVRNINNPLEEAISCVSDFLARKNGEYLFFAVPPGKYTIEIEPINIEFSGTRGSARGPSVGPYTSSADDKSFQNPVPKGFYTGQNLPITNNENEAQIIEVKANETLKDIDIIATLERDNNASLTITGPSEISLGSNGKKTKYTITQSGFTTNEICKVFHDGKFNLKIRQQQFALGLTPNSKRIVVKLPKDLIREIQNNNLAQDITFNINCSNGVKDEISLKVSP